MQRVSKGSVTVDGRVVGAIGVGSTILLGVSIHDSPQDALYVAKKVAGLRIFPDGEGKMQRSLIDIEGDALVVSQFTLYGDCSRGRRPSFSNAAAPEVANELYQAFCTALRAEGVKKVETGVFGAMMQVQICNDGPVTLIVDSPQT